MSGSACSAAARSAAAGLRHRRAAPTRIGWNFARKRRIRHAARARPMQRLARVVGFASAQVFAGSLSAMTSGRPARRGARRACVRFLSQRREPARAFARSPAASVRPSILPRSSAAARRPPFGVEPLERGDEFGHAIGLVQLREFARARLSRCSRCDALALQAREQHRLDCRRLGEIARRSCCSSTAASDRRIGRQEGLLGSGSGAA